MGRLAMDRVMRMGIGGALGGLISFLVMNPVMREIEESQRLYANLTLSRADALAELKLGAVVGAAIGVLLILAEEIQAPKIVRLVRNIVLGALVGGVIGFVGTIAANIIYNIFFHTGVGPLKILGRALGWGVMGAAAGLCPGIVTQSSQRITQGAVGGLIGGGIGGVLFDLLGDLTGGGSVSRFVGFVVMGFAIGLAVSLIEEIGKTYWLTAVSGAKEGRSFILAKPITLLGRDELVDIPLFGDTTVQKRHARLMQAPGMVTLAAEPGLAVVVNGQTTPQAMLQEGDLLEIGRHRFRFHGRTAAYSVATATPTTGGYASPTGTVTPGGYLPTTGAIAPGYGMGTLSQVTVLAGPHMGAVFALTPGGIVGRDPRCDIVLLQDPRASRQHARFVLQGAEWWIEDGNSANGTYLNGERVTLHVLASGDQIVIGDSLLQVS